MANADVVDQCDGEDRREHLLDHFPLDDRELKLLLNLACSMDHFSATPFLQRLFEKAFDTVYTTCSDDAAQFLEAVVSVCGRRGDATLWRMMELTVGIDEAFLNELISMYIALCPEQDVPEPPKITVAETKSDVSLIEWIRSTIPTATTLLAHIYSKKLNLAPRAAPLVTPVSISRPLWSKEASVPFQLALMDLGGTWNPLYRSDYDGLSFHTFVSALTGFVGPTITLIQTTNNELLGYLTEIPWKTSMKWYTGQGESFLFRLHPEWSIYLPQFRNTNIPKRYHQYLFLPYMSKVRRDLDGFAIGGVTASQPRVHIPPSLEGCKACSVGSTFESGPLLSNPSDIFFDVQALEVWSVRGDFAAGREAGKKQVQVMESNRQRMARVDGTEFVDHLARYGSTLKHERHVRPDAAISDRPETDI